MPGQLLNGRYKILERLSEPIWGTTYLATSQSADAQKETQKYVIRALSFAGNPLHLGRIAAIEQAVLALQHCGEHLQIPRLLDHQIVEQKLYLVRDYVAGNTIRQEIQPGQRQSEAVVTELLKDVLEILVFVHQNQIVHGNLKPENLIRGADRKLACVDFGHILSLCTATVTSTEICPIVMGQPGYLAPEQARGILHPASDLYALGMIGIEALTGVAPHRLPEAPQTGTVQWRDRAQVSDRLAEFLDRLINNRYQLRFATAMEALQALLTQAMVLPAIPPSLVSQPTSIAASPAPAPALFSPTNSASTPSIQTEQFEFETAILVPLKQGMFAKASYDLKRSQVQSECFIEPLGKEVALEMVLIPGGTFLMGSASRDKDRSHNEMPQHFVTIRPFFMSKFPITQAQWRAVATLPQVNQELVRDPAEFSGLERAIESVSWEDAIEFCARLSQKTGKSYSLPSEAAWEYACRAGTSTAFYFGDAITPAVVNCAHDGIDRHLPVNVGTYPANAFGLYEMHGNMWEWCLDHWHDDYRDAPTDGSAWLSQNELSPRTVRGGSWHSKPTYCRSASRDRCKQDARSNLVGFRVVMMT